eukprot:gnl/TRDRNA2_/TRDRNA2_44179_c0_seq1.p1 gnl/TRDRNA2_/TRDRNA2_44179_c0~~gnl/TRDRNA2_/TRDRNA2_44179_c0_seq1.p1  ORF type:complete len:632 (+),score=111.42 gnl/TRDRNA2_/TRDRNA2_44179_c0_seq1:96-1991(+)
MRATAPGPLLAAALVAFVSVGLIFYSPFSVDKWFEDDAFDRYDRHLNAFAALRAAGLDPHVDIEIVDFGGQSLGIGLVSPVAEGDVIFEFPNSLALDLHRTPDCQHTARNSSDDSELGCHLQKTVAKAISVGEASRLTALLVRLVIERRRGSVPGLPRTEVSEVINVLPNISWQQQNGLFSMSKKEFRVFAEGTSMEGWQDAAQGEIDRAYDFLRTKLPEVGNVTMQEVTWALLVLYSRGHWLKGGAGDVHVNGTSKEKVGRKEGGLSESLGLHLPQKVLFLWPLFLARPTPEREAGVEVRYREALGIYEVVANRAMEAGEEVNFVDRRFSDASMYSFSGAWLTGGRHRARLAFDMNESTYPRDPEAEPILQKYGCGGRPLQLYIQTQKDVDQRFMGCMRMLALASNASTLRRAEKTGWLSAWPQNGLVDQHNEATAADIAVSALQKILDRLTNTSTEIRQRHGAGLLTQYPAARVCEAEMLLVANLIKSMKELQLVSSNEYLFDTVKDAEIVRKEKSERSAEGDKGRKNKAWVKAGAFYRGILQETVSGRENILHVHFSSSTSGRWRVADDAEVEQQNFLVRREGNRITLDDGQTQLIGAISEVGLIRGEAIHEGKPMGRFTLQPDFSWA